MNDKVLLLYMSSEKGVIMTVRKRVIIVESIKNRVDLNKCDSIRRLVFSRSLNMFMRRFLVTTEYINNILVPGQRTTNTVLLV